MGFASLVGLPDLVADTGFWEIRSEADTYGRKLDAVMDPNVLRMGDVPTYQWHGDIGFTERCAMVTYSLPIDPQLAILRDHTGEMMVCSTGQCSCCAYAVRAFRSGTWTVEELL